MTMKLLPDIMFNEEARNQTKINITWIWSVKYRPKSWKSRFSEMQFLDMLKISDGPIEGWIFYWTICKMEQNGDLQNTVRPVKCKLVLVTSLNLLFDVMLSVSRWLASFGSFWWLKSKTAQYESPRISQITLKCFR